MVIKKSKTFLKTSILLLSIIMHFGFVTMSYPNYIIIKGSFGENSPVRNIGLVFKKFYHLHHEFLRSIYLDNSFYRYDLLFFNHLFINYIKLKTHIKATLKWGIYNNKIAPL
jgi:hypothetical protein